MVTTPAAVNPAARREITAEDFATIWCTLLDAQKVAQVTGLSHDAVRSRASRLRRKGVPLPCLRKGPVKPAVGDGAVMRQIRRKKRWSQAELADRMLVSQSTVSRMERGLLPVDIDMVSKLS